MESHYLPFREIPHTSKFFSTFLDDFARVSQYFAYPPSASGVDAAARDVRLDAGVRKSVVDILRDQNRAFAPGGELDSVTARNLDRLAAGAVAIVSGQQVGLFSGPAYTLYKALSAVRCADDATRRGIDAVPVFWLADEDHDLAEINHSVWTTKNGSTRYELLMENSGRRVGEILLGDSIESVVAAAASTLEGPFAAEVSLALHKSYVSSATYSAAFGKLMARVFAGRGLIFLNQLETRLHRLFAPVLRQAIEKAGALRDALLARSKELENAGLHAQVKVAAETTLLFSSAGGPREPLRSRNGHFLAGGAEISASDLATSIEKQPEQFSPSALLRPVIQDTILPTAAYVGGPSEIAYLAQSQVVYRTLGARMPAILPRASFTLVEQPIAKFLAQYGLNLTDVLAGRQHMRSRMEQKSLPGALAAQFDAGEEDLRRLLQSFEEPLARLDSTLVEALHGAETKMLHQFTQIKGKVARAENFRSGVLDRHERILIDSLAPGGELQERTLCLLPVLAARGPELLDELAALSGVGSLDGKSCAYHHQILNL